MKAAVIVLATILIILFLLPAMSMIRELPTIWHVLLGIVIIVTLGVGAIIGLLIVRKEEGQIES